jgi:2-polyprenyl-3-methyl-5-hydroxy-6-metoxy-1,4-benzoquinol methylase
VKSTLKVEGMGMSNLDLSNKEIYDIVYENIEDYNKPPPRSDKWKCRCIDQFIFDNKHDTILDVGCGSGYFLRRYHDQGLNITGIEISTVCCNKYLSGLKYYNMDTVDFANSTENKYDLLYCFGTLEHIRKQNLSGFLNACKKLSNKCLFGIANHPSSLCGMKLHTIRRWAPWWLYHIGQHFTNVIELYSGRRSRYYIIKGENSE